MRNRDELIWAAGFWDGEGYMGVAHQHWKGKLRKQAHAHLSQVDVRPLRRFHKAIGFGKVRARTHSKEWLMKHPNWSQQYRWDVSSFERVQALGAVLWKWLSPPKREQFKKTMKEMKQWYKRKKA